MKAKCQPKKQQQKTTSSVPHLSTHAPNSWMHLCFEARHSQKQTMNANRQNPSWASASKLLTPQKHWNANADPRPSPLCCLQHFRPKCEKVRAFTVVLCCVNLGCIIELQVDILSVEFSSIISCPLVTSGPGFLWLSLRLGRQWLMWSNEPRWQPVCGLCPSRAVQAHASCCVHLQTRAQAGTGWGPRHKLEGAKSLATNLRILSNRSHHVRFRPFVCATLNIEPFYSRYLPRSEQRWAWPMSRTYADWYLKLIQNIENSISHNSKITKCNGHILLNMYRHFALDSAVSKRLW